METDLSTSYKATIVGSLGAGLSQGVVKGDSIRKRIKGIKTQKAVSSDTAFLNLAPLARLELATYGLTVRRSTN